MQDFWTSYFGLGPDYLYNNIPVVRIRVHVIFPTDNNTVRFFILWYVATHPTLGMCLEPEH